MRAERTTPLRDVVAEIEIIDCLWVARYSEIILQRRGIEWRAALPATHHPRAQQHWVESEPRCLTVDKRIKLGNQLLQASEYHERTVFHPRRAAGGSVGSTEYKSAGGHDILAGKRCSNVRVEGRLRHAVQPAEMLMALLCAWPNPTQLAVDRPHTAAQCPQQAVCRSIDRRLSPPGNQEHAINFTG